MSQDISELSRLLNLPPGLRSAAWQSGGVARHGGDWWLAAVLEFEPERLAALLVGSPEPQLLETPPGLKLERAFAALSALPGAQASPDNGLRWVAPAWEPKVLAKSPLLNGYMTPLGTHTLFVLLHTN